MKNEKSLIEAAIEDLARRLGITPDELLKTLSSRSASLTRKFQDDPSSRSRIQDQGGSLTIKFHAGASAQDDHFPPQAKAPPQNFARIFSIRRSPRQRFIHPPFHFRSALVHQHG